MLFILIPAVLAILFFVLAYILEKKHLDDNIIGGIGTVSVISAAWVVISLAVLGVSKSSLKTKRIRRELNYKIEEINANRSVLLANSDKQLNLVEIVEYNKTVTEFKNDIQHSKETMKSLWFNWFVNNAYKDFTGDEVQYITQGDFE